MSVSLCLRTADDNGADGSRLKTTSGFGRLLQKVSQFIELGEQTNNNNKYATTLDKELVGIFACSCLTTFYYINLYT